MVGYAWLCIVFPIVIFQKTIDHNVLLNSQKQIAKISLHIENFLWNMTGCNQLIPYSYSY